MPVAMRHATAASLDRLEKLLAQLRQHGALKEKSRGVFYLRGKAALHFHEDPAGLFADTRFGPDWDRAPVDSVEQQAQFLRRVAGHLRGP